MAEVKFERPISPHLQIYKLSATMVMSIVHRITGSALYFGTLLLALWLLAVSGSADQFDFASDFFASWFGQLILFGYTWALLHHMLGGIRHLIWDTGAGFEPKEREFLAIGTLIGSVALTLIVWTFGYLLKG
jgi:succinate dehydrogenase / fumarate reductase, cytochrome b subunit